MRILITSIALVALTSCMDAQFHKSVRGNGNVTSSDRAASGFDGVRVSTGIDVYLSQGGRESVKVSADENLHEYIITEVKDGTLHIYFDNVSVRDAEMKRVYVTIKDVKSLRTSSAGDIIGETPLKCGDISLASSSAGDIRIELFASNVNVNLSSSGDIKLSGEADRLDANLSSAGDLNAFNFRVKEAKLEVSSAGDAEIFVTDRLTARASSAGNILYSGNPGYVDVQSSSAGSITKR